MRIWTVLIAALMLLGLTTAAPADPQFEVVIPFEFDPNLTRLVQAQWLRGTGCPTGATVVPFGGPASSFTDSACPTGDPQDKTNEGLLLVKTGPTMNFAAPGAELKNVSGMMVTELGFDIRKPGIASGGGPGDDEGSHCGAGAPRFNVVTASGTTFIGCSSAATPPTVASESNAWMRLQWTTGLPTDPVERIFIIFDEGTDVSGGPDEFGLAVLDNISVNGALVGRGPQTGK